MSLETGTYLDDLVITNPLLGDPRSEGDDHLRLIKTVLKNTFPNMAGAMNATQTELNYSVGVTSGIQAQLDAKKPMPSGTVCLFYQAAAPTGWTQVTTHNNKALRVVSGAGASSGGSVAFTTAFASQTPAGTVGNTTLTLAQIPSHSHTVPLKSWAMHAGEAGPWDTPLYDGTSTVSTDSSGGGGSHTHSFTGTAMNLAVQYVDVLIATKA